MSIVTRFFPNGEFSQGVDTSHKRRDKQRRDTQRRDRLKPECRDRYLQWIKQYEEKGTTPDKAQEGDCFLSPTGNRYYLYEKSSLRTTLYWEDDGGAEHYTSVPENFSRTAFLLGLSPLVYQMVESCDKPANRKKLDTMTKNMARNIRNGVYMLEQGKGGKDVLSFLTLTLPNLSTESLDKCCRNWDKIVKHFMDWLRITLKRKHIEFEYVYCTEIQSKRLQSRQEYAPHLHVVFRGRNAKKSPWAITPKQCRQAWGRALASFVDEPLRLDAVENLQRIKRSAARYLSKYLSKGCAVSSQTSAENNLQALRTQWGGMARTVSKAIRRAVQVFRSDGELREFVLAFVECLELLRRKGFVSYYRRRFIVISTSELDGAEYGINVTVGALSSPTYSGGLLPIMEYLGKLIDAGMVSRIVTQALTNVA